MTWHYYGLSSLSMVSKKLIYWRSVWLGIYGVMVLCFYMVICSLHSMALKVLKFNTHAKTWYLFGITSFGLAGCFSQSIYSGIYRLVRHKGRMEFYL
jgi:hypothetical protein